ncbi:MAG: RNB domain-containing ribonuclease, partial [Myxococcota bacterium]
MTVRSVDGAWVGADGRVLAVAGSALAQVYGVAVAGGLALSFPPACEDEAGAFVDPPDVDGLVDLRAVPFCTIDFETSRDLDQALMVERAGDGFTVWYAIADTTHFVRPGSAVHAEAVRRGSTVYLPGLCVPMLPFALCEGRTSLLPAVDRRALVFRMTVGPDGVCAETALSRAVIRSRCKTWYAAVQAWVDGAPPPCADPAVVRSLEAFAALGPVLLAGADRRGMLRVRREEVEVDVGPDGARFVALREGRHTVERWNEQVSLLANQEGARFLTRAGAVVDPIYRVMEPPAPERLAGLARLVGQIGAAHGRDLTWDPAREPLAALLTRVPDDDLGRVVHRQAMLVGGSAGFAPTPGPHAGVAADGYARFT